MDPSLSPVLHAAAYDHLGLPWTYGRERCDADGLAAVLARVRAGVGDWAGLSLTMPCKERAAGLLDGVEDDAAALGAVNTVTVAPDGSLRGANTDVEGVGAGLDRLAVPAGAPLLVLGAGGTARAVVGAAALRGHPLVVAARRREAADELVTLARERGVEAHTAREGLDVDAAVRVRPVAVVVSTLPVGGARAVATAGWGSRTPLLDVLYAPRPTPLQEVAVAAGARCVDGRVVLVGQAVGQVVRWAGPEVVARAGGPDALSARLHASLAGT